MNWIYIFLQKQKERIEYHKINNLSSNIEKDINSLIDKLNAIISLRANIKSTQIKESTIAALDQLKFEIENSKVVNSINCLIQNKKWLEFKNTINWPLNEVVQNLYEYLRNDYHHSYYSFSAFDSSDDENNKVSIPEFNNKINLHANRDILKSLKIKKKMIQSLKKQSKADLIKWAEDKENFYLEKYKADMKIIVSDAKCKVEYVQKELMFTHSYNAKEKQEMKKEIQNLTFKLEDAQVQNLLLIKQLNINNKKISKAQLEDQILVESSKDEFITLDSSKDDLVAKYLQDEQLKVINLKITNFHNIKDKTLKSIKNFIINKISGDLESVIIESDADKLHEILKYIKIFEGLIRKTIKSVCFQGFGIDSQSLICIFEASAKLEKLSFKKWVFDVDPNSKVNETLNFSISNLEFIGVGAKKCKESKGCVFHLISILKKTMLLYSLKQITFSQSNQFGSSLWESIKMEFKDQVETIITKDPWLFDDIL